MPKVYNMYDPDCPDDAINIGRRGIFEGALGNPFTHSKGNTLAEYRVATREEAVARHDVYFRARMKSDPRFARMVEALRGHDLKCFCAPRPCHGDNYLRYFEETANPSPERGSGR